MKKKINNIKKFGNFSIELITDDFEERFQKLFNSGKKVVYIKNEFDNSTFRYRCYNIVQALETQKEFVVSYFSTKELNLVLDYIKMIDIIVLQRAMWNVDIENFIFLAKNEKIPIIYDIDDLIFNPKYVPIYLNNLGLLSKPSPMFDVHFNFASKYYTIASKCDGFITTNNLLGNIINNDFGKPVWIIPNFLNKEQEYHSKQILKRRSEDKSKFVIGYFSGSPSHTFDFAIIVDEIVELFKKYKDIFLKIVGYIEIPEKLKDHANRIIQKPFVSFEELQYEIGEVDLNLVPLQKNVFNDCKSELKFFEAGIVNVVSCCSPTYIYRQIIKNGRNGFLCKEGEWFNIIENIYLERNNLKKIGEKAFITSTNLYGVSNQEKKIKEVYKDILKKIH